MRLVIQRVNKAYVLFNEKIVGKIDLGLFVLVGIGIGDDEKKVEELSEKLSKLRIMADENGKMNLSVKEVSGKILAVSQFTLFADTRKGNRPSFIKAGDPKKAERLYNLFVEKLEEKRIEVKTGRFGKHMKINAELDGPVTILME